ncbi:hypothetical protein FOL47_003347 [Perkinsus chesapeaki]|uniref:Mei2-like C-terminal RNA recognition motif domain-containing protein n=1 Tax=Perkinsus chesapeaki TaxID=330153 RepID=A0A7J6M8V8_PERCH|nr:hypothetical protein FOL47_003347 [Perkinsus chesapeaki]
MSNLRENISRPVSATTTAGGSTGNPTEGSNTDALFRMFGGTAKGSHLGGDVRYGSNAQLLASPAAAPQRTTVMLRNVPNDLGSLDLIAIINQEGFKGAYDFLFMPHERTPATQQGYAFINFLSEGLAHMFRKNFQGKPLTGQFLLKVGDVSDAKTQGFMDNMLPHQNRAPLGLHVFGCPEGTELVRGGRPIQLSLQDMIERNRAATEKAQRESCVVEELLSKGEVETMFDLKPRLVSYEIMQKKQGSGSAATSPRDGQGVSHLRAEAPEFKPGGMAPAMPKPSVPKAVPTPAPQPQLAAPQVRTPAPAVPVAKAPAAAATVGVSPRTAPAAAPKVFLISDLVALKNLATSPSTEDRMSTEEIGNVLNQWQLVPIKADERDLGPNTPPESAATSDQFVSAIEETKAKAAGGNSVIGVLFCESLLRGISATLIASMRKVDVLMLQTGVDGDSQERAKQIIARNEPFMYPVRCRTVKSIGSMITNMKTVVASKGSTAAASSSVTAKQQQQPGEDKAAPPGINSKSTAATAAAELIERQRQLLQQQQQTQLLQAQQPTDSSTPQLVANSQHVARCFWHPTDPNQLHVDTGDVMMVKSISPDGLWAWAINVRKTPQQPGWVPASVFHSPRSQGQRQQQQQQKASVGALPTQAARPRSAMSELAAKLEAHRGGMLPVGGGVTRPQIQSNQLMVVAESMRPGAPPVGTLLQLDSVNPNAGTMAVSWNNGLESGVIPIDLTNYDTLPHFKQGKHRSSGPRFDLEEHSSGNITKTVLCALTEVPSGDRASVQWRKGKARSPYRRNVDDLLCARAEDWCELETMTIPYESARKRALQLISKLEGHADTSPSPGLSLLNRLAESHSAVRAAIRVLGELAEDIGEECRERGELLWKLADSLQSKADAQLLAAAVELRHEQQAAAAREQRIYKDLTAEKARTDQLEVDLGRAEVTEAALRGREAELNDELEWLKVSNNKVMARRLKECSEKGGRDVGVSTDTLVGVERERSRCAASCEALLEALASPEVIDTLAHALPKSLASALRAIAANAAIEDGCLSFLEGNADDALPFLVQMKDMEDLLIEEEGTQTDQCAYADADVQAADELADCTGTQTDEPPMLDASIEANDVSECLLPSSTRSVGVVSDSQSTELSCYIVHGSAVEGTASGDPQPATDLEADELFNSDFVHLIDFSLLQASPRGAVDAAARRSPREALLGHAGLHALINRLYDSLTGQFSAAEGRSTSESVGCNVMAFLRRQHGVPSVLAERSWQLVQSLLRWQGAEAAPRSPSGALGTRCCTCSTVVQFLSGRRPFVEFRMMLYFRELLRRRSKYRHNLQDKGSSKATAAIKLAQDLFSGGVADSVATAVRAADAWKAKSDCSGSAGIVTDEFSARLIEALLDGWACELAGLTGPQLGSVQEAAVAYVDADANFAGRLSHVDCLAAAGGRGMGWTFEREDGPSHVGLADFAKEVGGRRAMVGVSELDAEIIEVIDSALSALELESYARSLVHSGDPGEEYAGRQYQSRIGIVRRLLINGNQTSAALEGLSMLAYFIFNECHKVRASSLLDGLNGKLIEDVFEPLLASAKAFKTLMAGQQTAASPVPRPPVVVRVPTPHAASSAARRT